MKITRGEIEKLKELCGKASPAPWEKQSYMNYFGWSVHSAGRGCIAERWYPSSVEIYPEGQEMCSNMEFIAAARTAVPALIARVEELENVNESSKSHCALLSESLVFAQREIEQASGLLTEAGVPTNGIGGAGKREELSITQRVGLLVNRLDGRNLFKEQTK